MAFCTSNDDCVFRDNNNETIVGIGICQENVCECSSYFGFTGEDCSEYSIQSLLAILIEALSFLGVVYILIRLGIISFRSFLILQTGYKGDKRKTLQINLLVVLLSIISAFVLLTQEFLALRTLFNPGYTEVLIDDFQEFITVYPGNLFILLLAISPVLNVFAILVTCISWLHLLEELYKVLNADKVTKVVRIRRVLTYVTIGSSLFIILLCLLELFFLSSVVIGLLFILVFVLVVVGRRFLVNFLKDFSPSRTKDTIQMVSSVAFYLQLLLFACVPLLIWEYGVGVRSNTSLNEDFDWNVFLTKTVSHIIGVTQFIPLLRYCSTINTNIESSTRTRKRKGSADSTSNKFSSSMRVTSARASSIGSSRVNSTHLV